MGMGCETAVGFRKLLVKTLLLALLPMPGLAQVHYQPTLESLNKQYGTRIIISDATRSKLTGRYTFRPLGDVVVKGKTQPVAIFEVTGRDRPPGGEGRRGRAAREPSGC